MDGKTVRQSSIVMPQRMLPQDANPAGNIHGGVILKHIDLAGAVAAMRHARCAVVTKSIDRMAFLAPVGVGELLIMKASVNMAGTTSMEVGVRVEAENLFTGEVRHAASAYLTFVAMSPDGRPREVPPLILESGEEHRRHREALARRETRRAEIARERASQAEQAD
jgi:acyl-CoA hydrolase